MSVIGIPVKGVIDDTLAIETKDQFSVSFGGQQINWQQYVANSYTSNNIVYQILPTSQDMVLDPKVLMLWSVQLNFTGTSASGNLLQLGTSDGLRALPATAAIGTGQIQVLVNGSLTATVQPDYVHQIAMYGLEHEETDRGLSMTRKFCWYIAIMCFAATMLDKFQNFGDWVQYGSARNPLALQGENAYNETRGGFVGLVVNSNTPTAAQATATFAEPLWASPMAQTGGEKGFVGLNTFNINIQIQNLTRIWCHGEGSLCSVLTSFRFHQRQHNLHHHCAVRLCSPTSDPLHPAVVACSSRAVRVEPN